MASTCCQAVQSLEALELQKLSSEQRCQEQMSAAKRQVLQALERKRELYEAKTREEDSGEKRMPCVFIRLKA